MEGFVVVFVIHKANIIQAVLTLIYKDNPLNPHEKENTKLYQIEQFESYYQLNSSRPCPHGNLGLVWRDITRLGEGVFPTNWTCDF